MEDRLNSLLSAWEHQESQGREVAAAELCRDCPDLEAELARRIEVQRRMRRLEPSNGETTGEQPTPEARTLPPAHCGSEQPATVCREETVVAAAQRPAVPGYEVLETLGKGGMGVVYKARQVALSRTVALKMILHAEHAGADERRRFQKEAEAVASLQHPNIVQIHEVDEHDGQPFFSLEFCGGGSLAGQLDGTPWEAKKAAQLVQTLARAMHAAHQAQVIHRDLKPHNVLLASDGTPKITDFGLAKKLDEQGKTQTGAIMGTPSYMAPEQAAGRKDVGPAADVYALGAILYELLTGRPPFKAATPLDTVLQVISDEPVPPRRLQPACPADLETIALKCLHKEPGKRYASALALAEDLGRFGAGEPIQARPVGLLERAVKWGKRRPLAAALAGVSVLAAGLLIGLGFWFSARMGAARGDLAAQEARTEAARQRGEMQEFFGLSHRVRERRAQPQAGWTWDNLDDLRKAAALPAASDNLVELRTEAAAALCALDVRQAGVVGDGVNVACVAFHPAGRLLALGDTLAAAWAVCSVRLVDPAARGPSRALTFLPALAWNIQGKVSPDGVSSLAFSPDGRWLVAGARSGRLHRWDLSRDPPVLVSWSGHDKGIGRLLFAPDGSALFSSGGLDRTVKRWDCRTWEGSKDEPRAEHTWEAPENIEGVTLHPSGDWLACQSDGKLHLLSAGTLRPVSPPAEKGGRLLQFSPGGRTLASAIDHVVHCESVFENPPPRRFLAPDSDRSDDGWIDYLAFSPSGDLLLTTSMQSRHVKLWGTAGGKLLADWPVDGGTLEAAFSPDGRTLAVAADNKTLLYEVGGLDVQTFLAHEPVAIEGMALHPDGRSLACLSKSVLPRRQYLSVWDLGQGAGLHPVAQHIIGGLPSQVRQPLSFHPGRPLLAHDAGEALAFWDTAGQPGPPAVKGVAPNVLRFGPDGRLWAVVGNDVLSWEPGEEKQRAHWADALSGTLTGLDGIHDLAAGREWVVAGGRNGRVYLLRAARAQMAASVVLDAGEVNSVALDSGETLAAAGTHKGELRLLRVPSGEVATGVSAHREAITGLSFAGGLLASGSRDRTVRLWRCDEGRLDPLLSLRLPGPVRSLAFHPDAVRLFVLVEGETAVRVFHLDRLRARLEALGLGAGLEGIETFPLPPAVRPSEPKPDVEAARGPGGLKAELFANMSLQRCVKVRYDDRLDFNWGLGSPDPLLPVDSFSIRWTGWLKAPRPGRCTLELASDDEARLWLDGNLCIDRWSLGPTSPAVSAVEVELTDRPHALRLEYREIGGMAGLRLFWSRGKDYRTQPIPTSAFFHNREDAERAPSPPLPAELPLTFRNSVGMEFVQVPRGKFRMGGGDGKPGDKEVEIPHDFYLGKYEVTQEEWQKVMGNNPSAFSRKGISRERVKDVPDEDLKRFPVEWVSWDDAQAFVKALNALEKDSGWVYRLPREAEWEYACRGGPSPDPAQYGFNYYLDKPSLPLPLRQANFERGLGRTCKVGSYPPNALGLHDMHGNVWEWCDDAEGAIRRVARGGGWCDATPACRAANRGTGLASKGDVDLGLRLARVPVGAPSMEERASQAKPR